MSIELAVGRPAVLVDGLESHLVAIVVEHGHPLGLPEMSVHPLDPLSEVVEGTEESGPPEVLPADVALEVVVDQVLFGPGCLLSGHLGGAPQVMQSPDPTGHSEPVVTHGPPLQVFRQLLERQLV